jgi:hypothetical protein
MKESLNRFANDHLALIGWAGAGITAAALYGISQNQIVQEEGFFGSPMDQLTSAEVPTTPKVEFGTELAIAAAGSMLVMRSVMGRDMTPPKEPVYQWSNPASALDLPTFTTEDGLVVHQVTEVANTQIVPLPRPLDK